ncbi:MAG: HlyD family efflux transporter periplasmic adaptor subunit [Rhodobacteraceae bacterium]|nr:HlyD family efflux transporter periplasmic adaptor subunit [Paracoccaceae bacterium]
MRFLRQALIGLVLMSMALGLLGYAGYLGYETYKEVQSREARVPQARERVFTVNVRAAEPQTITPYLTVFGEVQSRRTLDLRMAAGGQIVEISPNFAEGGVVEQGEILIRLDDADAQSALLRTESDLSDAKLEILRSAALLRQQDLQQRGVGTTASVEAAELALSSAKQSVLSRRSGLDQSNARFNQAKTRLARAELANNDALRHLNDTVMRAEFAGVLSGVSLVQGGLISANERVGQLIDPSALEVAFRVSTQQYARLLNDDGTLIAAPADVSLDAIGGSVTSKAVLSRDSGSVADGQTGRVLFAKLDNAIGLKPGDFVSVKVEEPALRFVVELPATALNAQNEVLAVGEGDRLETINVALVRRQGNNVLVRSRDLPGRDIVTQQTPLLGKGIKVKVLREGGSMEPEAPKMVKLTKEKQEELIKRVEGNQWIPAKPKERLLKQLRSGEIKAETLKRLESRGGG